MISAGVLIHTRILEQRRHTIPVMITENPAVSHPLLATYRRIMTSFFSPNFWATGMANPLQIPIQNPMIIKLREPVEPTEARARTPRYFPTMIVSIIL